LRFTPDGNFLERSCEPLRVQGFAQHLLGDQGGADDLLGPQPSEIMVTI
jgi:hypothetical protein